MAHRKSMLIKSKQLLKIKPTCKINYITNNIQQAVIVVSVFKLITKKL